MTASTPLILNLVINSPMKHRRLWFVLLCFLPVVLVLSFAIYASGKRMDEHELMFCLSFLGIFFLVLIFATYPPLVSKTNSALVRVLKREQAKINRLNFETKFVVVLLAGQTAILFHIYAGLNIFLLF